MEKISPIIPSTQRVKAVDAEAAGPVRPGTPGFGRRQGVSSLDGREKDQLTTAEKAVMVHKLLLEKRTSETAKERIAQQLADQFFLRKNDAQQNAGAVFQGPSLSEQVALIPREKVFSVQKDESKEEVYENAEAPEYGHPGEFIDVRV